MSVSFNIWHLWMWCSRQIIYIFLTFSGYSQRQFIYQTPEHYISLSPAAQQMLIFMERLASRRPVNDNLSSLGTACTSNYQACTYYIPKQWTRAKHKPRFTKRFLQDISCTTCTSLNDRQDRSEVAYIFLV